MKFPNPRSRRELDRLLAAFCDENLDQKELDHLKSWLASEPEARRYYLHYLDMHLELHRRVQHEPVAAFSGQVRHKRRPRVGWAWAAAAVVAVLVGIAVRAQLDRSSITGDAPLSAAEATAAIAYVGGTDGAAWDRVSRVARLGDPLLPGKVELTEGRLRIDFYGGAAMTVQAPAAFRLVDADTVEVERGQIAVESSVPGSHFHVNTPQATIVDIGTRFAVNVRGPELSEVLVDYGEVAVSLLGEHGCTRRERSLTEGEQVRIGSCEDGFEKLSADDVTFLTPMPSQASPLAVSAAYVRAVREAAPVGYWRFESIDGEQVANEMATGHKARVLGEVRLEGEGSNRVASLPRHEGSGFWVEEGFHEIYRNGEYSLEMWVNPSTHLWSGLAVLLKEGLPTEGSAAIRVDSKLRPPAPKIMALECMPDRSAKCWVVHESRAIRFFHRWPAEDFRHGATHVFSQEGYLPGRWHHVVAVRERGQVTLYLNGRRQSVTQVEANQDEGTYQLMLGRYARGSSDRKFFSGPFSGSMDEVALYDRALGETEVRSHYEHVNLVR